MSTSRFTTLFTSFRQELGDRIDWLVRLRWFAVGATLLIIAISNLRLPGVLPIGQLLIAVATLASYNVVIWGYRRYLLRTTNSDHEIRQATWLVKLQIGLDMLCVTWLLHLAGGAENPFYLYYMILVGLACALLPQTDAFWFAGLASLLYMGLTAGEYFGILPHFHLTGLIDEGFHQRDTFLIAKVFGLVSTAFFQAFFISNIVQHLRQQARELRESNQRYVARSERMKELNNQLRQANADCKAQRDQLTLLNDQFSQANLALEAHAQELTELNKRLEQVEAARTQFTLLVTHELRAPVAAIQSYLKLILEGYVPAEQQRGILERAETRALEQLALIADLLELGRVRERAHSRIELLKVEDVLSSVLDSVHAQVQSAQVEMDVQIGSDLPPLRSNPDQVKSLWMNLISNAIKYTPQGGHVHVSLQRDDGHLLGQVSDTGIGIPLESQPHIFDEFYRADNAKVLTRQGTGLGLAICKQIVEQAGGEIGFVSTPGQGTTFTFRLPTSTSAEGAANGSTTP